MNKSLIKLAFRHFIDISSTGITEKKIFADSYQEFRMQVQAYNREGKFNTLKEVIRENPKASSLQYKVGFSVGLYVSEYNQIIPGLTDSLGRVLIPFDTYDFEMIDSHIARKDLHQVAITYRTANLTLFGIIGDSMIVALGDQINNTSTEPAETFLIKIQPNLSIASWQDSFVNSKFQISNSTS